MEWFLFLGGTLIVISIILIRGRGRGSQSGPDRLEGSRPIGEIDTARSHRAAASPRAGRARTPWARAAASPGSAATAPRSTTTR